MKKPRFSAVTAFLVGCALLSSRVDAAPAEKKKAYMPSVTLQSLQTGSIGSGVMEPVSGKDAPVYSLNSNARSCSGADRHSLDYSVIEGACLNNQTVGEYLAAETAKKKAEAAAAKKKRDASKQETAKKDKARDVKPAGGVPVPGRNFMTCSDSALAGAQEACRNK